MSKEQLFSLEEQLFLEKITNAELPPSQTPIGGIYNDEATLLIDLKAHAALILLKNQVRVIVEKGDGFELLSDDQAGLWLAAYQLEVDTPKGPKLISGLSRYLKSTDCLRFTGLSADPRLPRRQGDVYSTWRGFNRKARRGSWVMMREHLLKNICGGNKAHFEWLMSWMAQIIQQPHLKLGTAVILRGVKGCGKTTVGLWLKDLIGSFHATKISQSSHLVGKFNQHLRDCFFLLVEEGVWGGNKQGEGVLKDIITGETLTIEGKGLAVVECPNFTRVMITSNEDWIVPATTGERRYFVLDCVDPFRGLPEDHPKRLAYFKALADEAKDGGLEAMMWELSHWDISRVNLRKPPMTEGLKSQIAQTFNPSEEWLFTTMRVRGFTDRDGTRVGGEWYLDSELEITSADLARSHNDSVKTYGGSATGIHRIITLLKKHGEVRAKRMTVGGMRTHGYVLGPLRAWRERFTKEHHQVFDDPTDE